MKELSIHEKVMLRWKNILEFGAKEPAVSPEVDPLVIPPWLDRERFKQAQENVKEYMVM